MIVLDTNVLCALMRPEPEPQVLRWLDAQPESSIWTTTITLVELRYGLQTMPAGRRRDQMTMEFEAVLREDIDGRYLPFDTAAAEQTAKFLARRKALGLPVEYRDTMIAGIVLATRATLATRNTARFADASITVINPWQA